MSNKFQAKQINILVEKLLEESIIDLLDQEGAKGYTLYEAGGNSSLHLHPMQHSSLVDAMHIVKFEVIVLNEALGERIAERVMNELLLDQPGILSVQDVWIFRPQKF